MPRARNIKPGFFQNEQLGELSPLDRLLFIGLWTVADFKGCVEMRPKRLKIQLLPYDECDILTLTNNLERSGFISIYSVEDQQYLKIHNFIKHQNPHKNEREAGSTIPDLPENWRKNDNSELIAINPEQNGTARADSLLLIPDSGFPPTSDGGGDLAQKTPPPKKPLPQPSEILIWLDAISPVMGAKNRKTLANYSAWERFVKNAISEGYAMNAVLDTISGEKVRLKDMPQFLSPDGILKILQANNGTYKNGKSNDLQGSTAGRSEASLRRIGIIT